MKSVARCSKIFFGSKDLISPSGSFSTGEATACATALDVDNMGRDYNHSLILRRSCPKG
jgi:hypothetical protein